MPSSIATDLATVLRIVVINVLVTLRRGVCLCLALLKEETLLPYVITCIPRIRGRRIYISLSTTEPPQLLFAIPLGS